MEAAVVPQKSAFLRQGIARLASAPTTHDAAFLAVWGVQAQLAVLTMLTMAALIGTWQAVLAVVPWGLAFTHVYETARRRGLKDVMETPSPSIVGVGPQTLSWAMYGLKVYFLGYKQFIYTRICKPLIQSKNGGLPRKIAITVGLILFGITASHHILRLAGLSTRQIYWGNMAARFLQIPMKILETTVFISLVQFALDLIPLSDQLNVVGSKGWGFG